MLIGYIAPLAPLETVLSYYFVTGCNAGFFNTLLITLQSFAVRMPGQRLLVCDYGLTPPQCEFLRRRGLLLERPPAIPRNEHPYRCKAALLRYIENGGNAFGPQDTIIWLDADLTLLDVGIEDFAKIIEEMKKTGAEMAACSNGLSVRETCDSIDDGTMIPFRRAIAFSGIDQTLPYYSIGIFFCRSAEFLKRWDEVTSVIENHMCFEQNMFTMLIHRDRVPFMAINMDEWQAQGVTLEKIAIETESNRRPVAVMGQQNVKIIHTTSSGAGHIMILKARMMVMDAILNGTFKLLAKQDQFKMQIDLLADCIKTNKNELLQLGICSLNPQPVGGFQFQPLK